MIAELQNRIHPRFDMGFPRRGRGPLSRPLGLGSASPVGGGTAYDISNPAIFVAGRTLSFVNNGNKTKMMSRSSFIEFETNSIGVVLNVSAAVDAAYRVYVNGVYRGTPSLVGTIGLGSTQTLTIAGFLGGANWTSVKIVPDNGNEGFVGFLDTATVTTMDAGTLRFKTGANTTGMLRENCGGATAQSLGSFNSSAQSDTTDIPGMSSPFAVGNTWQVIGERKATAYRVGIMARSGGSQFALYRNGAWVEELTIASDDSTNWQLAVFATPFDVTTEATYSVHVKGGPGQTITYLDEMVLFGDGATSPAFGTTPVVRTNGFAMFGDSIEFGLYGQDRVWGLVLAEQFSAKFFNRGHSGYTITQVNTDYASANTTITAGDVTVCMLGIGENDLATPQATFETAVTSFINQAFSSYPNLKFLFVRGIQPADATYNGYLQNAIAASAHAADCVYRATPVGIATQDGQHPTGPGYVTMAAGFAADFTNQLTAPTVSTITINANGTTGRMVTSATQQPLKIVEPGTLFTLTVGVRSLSCTQSAFSGNFVDFNINGTVLIAEVATATSSFAGPELTDSNNNAVTDVTGFAVTNNSTQVSGGAGGFFGMIGSGIY